VPAGTTQREQRRPIAFDVFTNFGTPKLGSRFWKGAATAAVSVPKASMDKNNDTILW
jgi:hypothetical protein